LNDSPYHQFPEDKFTHFNFFYKIKKGQNAPFLLNKILYINYPRWH